MPESSALVLIVDDEKDVCDVLCRLLKPEGLQVLVAYDGKTALKMIVSEIPDLLITDFKMPGIDGMELLKRAKEIDPELPVVMITGYADVYGAVEAMRAGALDYMPKPFENYEVIRVVRRALEERDRKRRLNYRYSQLQESYSLRELIGPSDAISRLISREENLIE